MSRRPATASRPRIVQICQSRQHADLVPSAGSARCRRRTARRAAPPAAPPYSSDVDRRARRSPFVSGTRFGPRWQPNGVGPQPVQDRPHRREEPVVQRPEPAAEPDDLEQHGVEHDLLEHDRFGPPLPDVGEAVDALGGQREQPAAEDVEQDLDDVEQVHARPACRSRPRPSAWPSGGSSRSGCPCSTRRSRRRALSGFRNPMAGKTRTCSSSALGVRPTQHADAHQDSAASSRAT